MANDDLSKATVKLETAIALAKSTAEALAVKVKANEESIKMLIGLLDNPPIDPPDPGTGALVDNAPAPTGPDSIPLYDDFRVTIEGEDVPVYRVNIAKDGRDYPGGGVAGQLPIGVCNFGITGPVTATVTVRNRTVVACDAPVRRYNTVLQRAGNVITVPIAVTGQYVIGINNSEDNFLVLCANPPQTNIPKPGDANTTFYGPGVHKPGRKTLPAGHTVYAAPGAVVHGSFVIPNDDCTIRGPGIFSRELEADCGDGHFFETSGRNITLKDFMTVGGQPFHIRLPDAEDVVIDNVKLFSARRNSDGIDPTSARRVKISECLLGQWDDGITLKDDANPSGGCLDIEVTDCLFLTRSGWRLIGYGAEGGGNISRVSFKRCSFLWTHAMNMMHTETPNNPYLSDWTFEDLWFEKHYGHDRTGMTAETHFISLNGRHSNFTFRRIYYTGPILPPSNLSGDIDGVTIQDIFWRKTIDDPYVKLNNDALLKLSRSGNVRNVTYN